MIANAAYSIPPESRRTVLRVAEERVDWKHAHAELLRLSKQRAALDCEEGKWLLQALRTETHTRLGHGSFAEYVQRLFGYSPRWTSEKLRVAEALETLPAMTRALREGALSWSVVRELTRVATPENEAEWLAAAKGKIVRQVEAMVSGRGRGDRPSDPPQAEKRRHVLRFEVNGETYALFREAMGKVRRDAGGPLDDDAALLLVARRLLGGPKDEGRSSFQIVLHRCDVCGRAQQEARGELVEVGPEVLEMAECDAQHVDLRGSEGTMGEVKEATDATVDAPVGADSGTARAKTPTRPRAVQGIPPSVRRLVMRRDHGRCRVPGCSHGTFLDLHHVDLRSEGGGHDPERMLVLCGAHHKAQHSGRLIIDGSHSTGFRFRHPDGTCYGGMPSPAASDVAKVFGALRNFGFRESDARVALDRVTGELGVEAGKEQLLRAALQELTGGLR